MPNSSGKKLGSESGSRPRSIGLGWAPGLVAAPGMGWGGLSPP